MNGYQLASVILALALYAPLGLKILQKKVEQNIATFFLWGSLDLLVGVSIYTQGGDNFALPFAYVGGCAFIISCILIAGTYKWTSIETRAAVIVAICTAIWSAMVWGFQNPYYATIFSTLGVVAAGIPQLYNSWYVPAKVPTAEYAGYTVANILSTVGGASWTVVDRLFPGACTILCGVFVLVGLRKFSPRFQT